MDIDDVDTSSESEEKISSDEDTPLLEEAMEPQKENLDAAVKEEVSDDTVNMGAVILAPAEAGMNVEENAILPGGLVVQDDGFDESQRNEEEDMAQTSKAMDVDNTVDMAQEGWCLKTHLSRWQWRLRHLGRLTKRAFCILQVRWTWASRVRGFMRRSR